MPVIDFTEIQPANSGNGKQDTFELFARDFLSALGFRVDESPSRGADGGKDLLVVEPLSGLIISGARKWVVSCKHYVHSGKAVSDSDEINIMGRVNKFKANGFMAFYSTLPSSGLAQTFMAHKDEISIEVFDSEKIESLIISDSRLQTIFKRYFPKSYKTWQRKTPTVVFGEYTPLECAICGKDLLIDKKGNICVAINVKENRNQILDIYWACKSRECDKPMQQSMWEKYGAITHWVGLDELAIPAIYMRWVASHFSRVQEGKEIFADEAFKKFRLAILCVSQIVVKETTPEQWEQIERLPNIPSILGGLDFS